MLRGARDRLGRLAALSSQREHQLRRGAASSSQMASKQNQYKLVNLALGNRGTPARRVAEASASRARRVLGGATFELNSPSVLHR